MKRYFLILLVCAVVSICGCSKADNPLFPGIGRTAQGFNQTGLAIFGTDTVGSGFGQHFHDVAIAQIMEVGDDAGSIAFADHGCLAVTLSRIDGNIAGGRFKPIFRWLAKTEMPGDGVDGGPFWVTERDYDDFQPDQDIDNISD